MSTADLEIPLRGAPLQRTAAAQLVQVNLRWLLITSFHRKPVRIRGGSLDGIEGILVRQECRSKPARIDGAAPSICVDSSRRIGYPEAV